MYAKLFSSILDSSLWALSSEVCKLCVTMLAMADPEGYVYASDLGIAHRAYLQLEAAEEGFRVLSSSDPYSSDISRDPDCDGRRIERVPGGWKIVNFQYYRGLRDRDERREQNRQAQERFRKKDKPPSAKISHGKPISESESDTESVIQVPSVVTRTRKTRAKFSPPTIDEVDRYIHDRYPAVEGEVSGSEFVAHYEANGWVYGKSRAPMKSWKGALYAAWIAPRLRGQR